MRLENRFPIFKRGCVIKKKDLDLIRDNAIEILKLSYIDKKNGIIKGFNFFIDVEKNKIVISEGILKYRKNIYWTTREMSVEIPLEEDKYILKVKLDKNIENRRYLVNTLTLIIEKGTKVENDEIEIGRFINRIGAELRNDYKNFKDLKRDYNLIEIINIKYASKNIEGTLHPKILEFFALDGLKKRGITQEDSIFFFSCLNSFVERESIVLYINRKLKLEKNDYTNEELYYSLMKILENINDEIMKVQNIKMIPKKIMID